MSIFTILGVGFVSLRTELFVQEFRTELFVQARTPSNGVNGPFQALRIMSALEKLLTRICYETLDSRVYCMELLDRYGHHRAWHLSFVSFFGRAS
jgi:hypothetical protein